VRIGTRSILVGGHQFILHGPLPPEYRAEGWGSGSGWWAFAAYHSRHYARHMGATPSLLMRPDKLATHLYPRWLYVLLLWSSGEWVEYRDGWVAKGTYPGSPTDGVRAFCGHLQSEWSRFLDLSAPAMGERGL
jgi:hypothetical protein